MDQSHRDSAGYVISFDEKEDLNVSLYKLSQMPVNWINKGFRLKRDAFVFFDTCEKDRAFIIQGLKEIDFPFERFYRHNLQDSIQNILDDNIDKHLPTFDTFYLLMHLSFENFLKGIWLDQNRDKIGFEKIPVEIKTHDLVDLCKKTNIKISAQEEMVLKKMVDLFLGYSRYPVKLFVKSEEGAQPRTSNIDFGERNFDSVCIDCLENPYAEDRQTLLGLLDRELKPLLERAVKSQHEHLIKIFNPEYI